MDNSLRNRITAAIATGASSIVIATVMLTGKGGLEGREHVAYKDVVGVLTVCDGHTGSDIIPWKHYTDAECDSMTSRDLEKVAKQIDPYIKSPIPRTMRAALYSFTYNVGAGNFQTSTLLYKINKGDPKGACEQLRRWTYAGGKQWKGLMNRREIEREVCLWEQK